LSTFLVNLFFFGWTLCFRADLCRRGGKRVGLAGVRSTGSAEEPTT
jgi:hypothetical protein